MIEQYLKGLKVPKDELTAIERNKLLNEGKDVDRIMCCIDSGETLAPLIGCTLPEYYFSAEKMCELAPAAEVLRRGKGRRVGGGGHPHPAGHHLRASEARPGCPGGASPAHFAHRCHGDEGLKARHGPQRHGPQCH